LVGKPEVAKKVEDFLYLCKVLKAVPKCFGIAFSLLAAKWWDSPGESRGAKKRLY
jgi:hypothetical protein